MAKITPGSKTLINMPDRDRPASAGIARTVQVQPAAVFLNPGGAAAVVVPTWTMSVGIGYGDTINQTFTADGDYVTQAIHQKVTVSVTLQDGSTDDPGTAVYAWSMSNSSWELSNTMDGDPVAQPVGPSDSIAFIAEKDHEVAVMTISVTLGGATQTIKINLSYTGS